MRNFVPQTHPASAKASGCQWKHFDELWIRLLYRRMVSERGRRGQGENETSVSWNEVRKLRPDSLGQQINSLSTRCGLLKCLTPRGDIPLQLCLSGIQKKKTDQNAVNLLLTFSAHDLDSDTHMQSLRNETFYQMNSTPLLHRCYTYHD